MSGARAGRRAVAVLTAAGAGNRLGAHLPKALVSIKEHTLLQWSLLQMHASGSIGAVVITAPLNDVQKFADNVAPLNLDWPVAVVAGGVSRQSSVAAGLEELAALCREVDFPLTPETPVLVHDAARCFAPPELFNRLIGVVETGVRAVVPGLPVTDTIKIIGSPDGDISPVQSTPRRDRLRAVQTPQAFHWELLLGAHQKFGQLGKSEATAATDDAALVELLGFPVWVCAGDPRARKITTREDLAAGAELLDAAELLESNYPN